MDCGPPGSPVHGILQARTLEWVARPSSRGPSQPRNRTLLSLCLLHWQASSLPLGPPGKLSYHLAAAAAKSPQSYPTLFNTVDCSLPGSSVHWILQARILEWVARPSSRGPSRRRDRTQVSCLLHWQAGSLPLARPGKPRWSHSQ